MRTVKCKFGRRVGYCKDVNCCYYMDNGGCSAVSKQDTARKILLAHMKLEELKRLRLEQPVVKQRKNNTKKSPVKQKATECK